MSISGPRSFPICGQRVRIAQWNVALDHSMPPRYDGSGAEGGDVEETRRLGRREIMSGWGVGS